MHLLGGGAYKQFFFINSLLLQLMTALQALRPVSPLVCSNAALQVATTKDGFCSFSHSFHYMKGTDVVKSILGGGTYSYLLPQHFPICVFAFLKPLGTGSASSLQTFCDPLPSLHHSGLIYQTQKVRVIQRCQNSTSMGFCVSNLLSWIDVRIL